MPTVQINDVLSVMHSGYMRTGSKEMGVIVSTVSTLLYLLPTGTREESRRPSLRLRRPNLCRRPYFIGLSLICQQNGKHVPQNEDLKQLGWVTEFKCHVFTRSVKKCMKYSISNLPTMRENHRITNPHVYETRVGATVQ